MCKTAGIKKYKSIIKKKRKKHNKIVLWAKSKLNYIVLISMTLIDSNIIHDEYVLINNVLKEFYDMKEEIKNFNDIKTICKRMLFYCLKRRKLEKPKILKL